MATPIETSSGRSDNGDRVQGAKSEFTPQLDEIKAMARQDVAAARERLAEGRAIGEGLSGPRTREGPGYRALRRSRPGMVDQASVNGRGTARVPGSSSAGFDGVAEFVDDLASLAELQARLAAVDLQRCRPQSRRFPSC